MVKLAISAQSALPTPLTAAQKPPPIHAVRHPACGPVAMRYVVGAWFSSGSADGPSGGAMSAMSFRSRACVSSIQVRSGSATTTPRRTKRTVYATRNQ
jgi:hypothetical protein